MRRFAGATMPLPIRNDGGGGAAGGDEPISCEAHNSVYALTQARS